MRDLLFGRKRVRFRSTRPYNTRSCRALRGPYLEHLCQFLLEFAVNMQIRPFQSSDLQRLREITVEAFDGVSIDQAMENAFGLINGHNWQWRKGRHLDDDVARDPGSIFVAEEEGRILGCITAWMDHEAGVGHIPNLALTPESRGKGFGRQLIEFAIDHFRKHGMTHARIETLVQNGVGNHLYTSVGFREVSRQIHFAMDLTAGADTVVFDD
jgi:ribosomal protein S18 acetylase RimI-like enzyme